MLCFPLPLGERVAPGARRERGIRSRERARYFFQYNLGSLQRVIVPETYHAITLAAHPFIASAILNTVYVLAAIEFDDKFCPVACEVRDCTANRNLTAEMIPIGLQES